MKTPAVLLLNVALVAMGLAAYHVLHSHPAPTEAPRSDTSDLEARLAAMEARVSDLQRAQADPAPLPADHGDRVDAMEERLQALESDVMQNRERASARSAEGADANSSERLAEEVDVGRFRKLAEKVRREDMAKKVSAHVKKVVAKLDLSLTEDQNDQVARAFQEFAPRRNELWAEAKARGAEMGEAVDWTSIIRETNEVVNREFSDILSEYIAPADAALVSEALHSKR
ncbi:MAG: hypothetical protein ACYTDX_02345 [Planctomycetota bacterium]|jgi:hypothetical protein